jgi:mannose-6-phosphate isomerase-like protein (cupin superfamily)
MTGRDVISLEEADSGVLHGAVGTFRILLDEHLAGTCRHSLLLNTMRAGVEGDPHAHPDAEQSWYILSGRGTFHVDGRSHRIGPNMALYAPAGSTHSIDVDPGEDLTYLAVYAPGGPEELLRAKEERAFDGE